MNLKSNLKKQLFVTAVAQTPPHHPSRPRWVGMLLVLKGDRESVVIFCKNDIGAESVNTRGNNSNSRKFKREKRRDHAPTHGQFPCPAFGSHDASVSASDSLDFFFSYICPLFFYFFLSSFSLTFSIRTRYLSSIVSLYTFAHAHIATFARSKCQKKFGATFT